MIRRSQSVDQRLAEAATQWEKLFNENGYRELREQRDCSTGIPVDKLKENVPKGDHLQHKNENTFRIYFQNVNGLKLDALGGDFTEVCYVAAETQSDVLAIAESNLDFTQHYVRKTCFDAVKKVFHHSKLEVSDTPIQTKGAYKPGGTMVLSQGSVLSRLVDSGADSMGRWSFQTFQGKNTVQVTVIVAYQVCHKNASQRGRYTAAAQQESLLRQRNEADTNPRRHFRKDLSNFIRRRSNDGQEIILVGDFNEPLDEHGSGMAQLCQENELRDIFNETQGLLHTPTYSRGKKRLDYALVSSKVLDAFCAGGYEPFNSRLISDHRAFFLDFDVHALFGCTTPILPNRAFRDIDSRSPKQVASYIRTLHELLSQRKVFDRASQLLEADHPNDHFAECLDRDMERLRIAAARGCVKLYEPAWSTTIAKARAKVGLLFRVLSARRTHLDPTDSITSIQANYDIDFLIPETVAECQRELRQAQSELRILAKEAANIRLEEQARRISELELSGTTAADRKRATILRNIRKAEEIKKMFRKIRSQRETNQKVGVRRLEVPLTDGDNPKTCLNWRTIDAPSEVVEHLRARNRSHFGQAQGTPFTVPPLSQEIDFTASTMTTEMILDGEYSAMDMSETTQLLIKHMRRSEFVNHTKSISTISDKEFCSKLKLWKESTTTSPSGLHLGHWKSLVARHQFSDTDTSECEELDSMQQAIRAVCLSLVNYALRWGYSYERWKTIVNIMIFKEPGNIKIHRLRVIHIYEADYNLILGVKWRTMIHQAEDANALHPGQYGGRPYRNALDPVFMEELTREISRASLKPIVTLQNDAASCYDRIIPSLASLVSRKFGVTKTVTLVMAKTLQEAKYKLKTMLGVSEEYYQHCEFFPIYGTGQGSGNSPAIWCVISSVLFEAHSAQSFGATYESPDKLQTIRISMVGFVDDSTGQVNAFLEDVQPNIDVLLQRMRYDAQLWNDLLWTSGGELELNKCSYQVMNWEFTTIGEPSLQAGKVGEPIVLSSGDRASVYTLDSTSAYSAYKTLGHFKAPSGNQTRQYQELKVKADKMAAFLQCSSLDRKEAWTFYFAIFLPSIGYPLANSTLAHKECDQIQRRAFRAIVSKCGFNRNTAKAILYGPIALGGANFRHLYTEQGVGQIILFLRHWRMGTQPGTMLNIAVAWAQYAVGTGVSFLEDTTTKLPHLPVKWLKSLRGYLHNIHGSLQLDRHGVLPLQREHDAYLMDLVIASPIFTETQIKQVNYCRTYLQVLTLSDISLPDGAHIDPTFLSGEVSLQSSLSRLHHFNRRRPPTDAWVQWRRACCLWADPTGKFCQALGLWTCTASEMRRKWFAYFDSTEDTLYVANGNNYDQFWIRGTSTEGTPQVALNPSASAVPISVCLDSDLSRWTIGTQSYYLRPRNAVPPGTFNEYITGLDEWEKALLAQVEIHFDPFTIHQMLLESNFAITSDGSVRYETDGAFGWSMSLHNGTRLASAAGPVYGYRPSSYRAEGYGMLSGLRFLIRLFQFCGGETNKQRYRHCAFASDNEALVDCTKTESKAPSFQDTSGEDYLPSDEMYRVPASPPLASDWDVVNEIQFSLSEIPFGISIFHVKGHQDRTIAYNNLSLSAQLNVEADLYASQYQDQHGAAYPLVLMFPHTKAQLNLSQGTVTSRVQQSIRRQASEPTLFAHVQKRNKWSEYTMNSIDWEAHRIAISRMPNRVHTIKLVHDILPTNHMVSKYQVGRSDRCPCCSVEREDRDHILRCPHETRELWRSKCLQRLHQTLDYIDTRPFLGDILMEGISEWFRGSPSLELDKFPLQYRRLIIQQNSIGWRQVFNGRLSCEWSRHQDDFLQSQRLRSKSRSGKLWSTTVITCLWKQWLEVWTSRNDIIHGHDETTRRLVLRNKAEWQIRKVYKNRELYLPRDRDFLFETVEEHLTQSTTSLLNWFSTYQPMFAHSALQAKKHAIKGVRSIRSYFQPRKSVVGLSG